MNTPPESVQQLEKAITSMVEEIQIKHLVPRQKEAFLCCAKCCDTESHNAQALQGCVERCSMGPANSQKVIQQLMNDFQERFQRCAMRCQDSARESISYDATTLEQEKAQGKFTKCMDECGREFVGKVPKVKADIISALKRT